jgi:quercetin dioxygenase-like cupin family protein
MTLATPLDLRAETDRLLQALPDEASGRLAHTLAPGAGAPLKQTLIALLAGTRLQDHRAPGQATILVLAGRVRLTVGDDESALPANRWAPVPAEVHGLVADEDSVALLTVANASAS